MNTCVHREIDLQKFLLSFHFSHYFMHLDKLQRKYMDSVSEGSRVFKLKSVLINASDWSLGNH